MNINGLYNFEYNVSGRCFNNERFCYPKIFEEELKDWFLLLKDPNLSGIRTKNSTISGYAINNSTKEILLINLKSNFNSTDLNDNPFAFFSTSIEAAYFWINGDYVQRGLFDS
ncbi:6854_t:CDS:2 [Funneliformis mosseae]|uniref:6854_t:CDS:1 n=1 Tax=Funneliformis mosseae TaxID=27381 RepID=A0A9N9G6X7_FUNMO|nr:6854_t:CDS:2 [Funneliformis mosseae]